jgi:hypothetical protein
MRRPKRTGHVWNTLPATFEANVPTMCAKRLAMFPSWPAFEDVRWPEVSSGHFPVRPTTRELNENGSVPSAKAAF